MRVVKQLYKWCYSSQIDSPPSQREVRELTRYRTSLVQERSRAINRLQKALEDTNIKLASVVSDLVGASARDVLAALLEGETDVKVLAQLARGNMRSKREALEQARPRSSYGSPSLSAQRATGSH